MDQTWIRGPVIGRGATSTVSLASSPSRPNSIFALKSSHISHSASLLNEHQILSKLPPHPNLITTHGFHLSGHHFNLLTEYVPGGTLADRFKKNGLTEPMIQFYASQILMGLDFLHANGIVHCDIKSENVLLGEDGFVKIADLGFSKVEGSKSAAAFSGTPAFMAPEVARGEAQGFAADVWALGCTIVEMANGKNPWPEERNPVSALYRIGFSGDVPTIPNWLSEKGKDFVGKCLMRDPALRWTTTELLKHPFITDFKVVNERLVKTRSSPTCVLDLAFWDHLDEDDDDEDVKEDVARSISATAFERIERLHSIAPSTSSWSFDENWITVRTKCIHHQQSQIEQIDLVSSWDHEECGISTEFNSGTSRLVNAADADCVSLNLTCTQEFSPDIQIQVVE